MNHQVMILQVPTSVWYSPGEENAFFQWLYSLSGYINCNGEGRVLSIEFDLNKIEKNTACDLVAMFRRYFPDKIHQLNKIKDSPIGNWFSASDTYWYRDIFS